jgi:hypothetical protein
MIGAPEKELRETIQAYVRLMKIVRKEAVDLPLEMQLCIVTHLLQRQLLNEQNRNSFTSAENFLSLLKGGPDE